METAKKITDNWAMASQSYFESLNKGESKESASDEIVKYNQDLKDNSLAYLNDLSMCKCCERHQVNRPNCKEDYKKFTRGTPSAMSSWNIDTDAPKTRKQFTSRTHISKFGMDLQHQACYCACRNICREIVINMGIEQ